MDLQKYLLQYSTTSIIDSFEYDRWLARIKQGVLTRDENAFSHCCVMAVIYNSNAKKIFVVDHKKADMWLFPGGHIDKGELPLNALVREIKEELGLDIESVDLIGPFGMQIIDMDNPRQLCEEHYDTFYALENPSQEMKIDMREFRDHKWLSIPEAFETIQDEYYKRSLKKFISFIGW